MNRSDVLIIGAGAAGLSAARELVAGGRSVIVLDKGRSPGGRLATRRIGAGRADHGAQFFTVRTPEFGRLVDRWLAGGLIYEWSRGWSDGSLLAAPGDGYPRYAARDGFVALARAMAAGLDVRLSTRLVSAAVEDGRWQAVTDTGEPYSAAALVLTPPMPQSLALLDAGGVVLPGGEREALERIRFAPCLCGMFLVEGDVSLPEPGAVQRPGAAVSWLADNRRKGISPGARVITVHAGPEASEARWTDDDAAVLGLLEEYLRLFLAPGAAVAERQLKRWRYAVPVETHPERSFRSALPAPLVFAGDAFDGPRVEGAVLSGQAAAQRLIDGQ